MRLAERRKAHAERLRWHFGTEASDSGLRSSFGAAIDRALSGTSSSARGSGEDRVLALVESGGRRLRAHREIEALLTHVGSNAETLRLAFTPRRRPTGTIAVLGELAPLATLTASARKAFETAVTRARKENTTEARALELAGIESWLKARSLKRDSPLLARIRAEAEALVTAALNSFDAAIGRPTRERHAVEPNPFTFVERS